MEGLGAFDLGWLRELFCKTLVEVETQRLQDLQAWSLQLSGAGERGMFHESHSTKVGRVPSMMVKLGSKVKVWILVRGFSVDFLMIALDLTVNSCDQLRTKELPKKTRPTRNTKSGRVLS